MIKLQNILFIHKTLYKIEPISYMVIYREIPYVDTRYA